jgi:TPP-dependent pyruvate/acetoin dehydrogenase alpha subunit
MAVFNAEQLTHMYATMVCIRLFEQKTIEVFARRIQAGQTPGALHSSEGQEAIAVGVLSTLLPDDYVFSTYRGHGHAIAQGMDLNKIAAEIHGAATGVSRGYGGSMHLFDVDKNFMGGNGIVGGNLPLALGTAYASVKRGTDQVTAAFFGDGGSAQGSFHESMNMAAIMKWPLLFLCENNHYAATTPVALNCPIENIGDRANGYGIPGLVIDGNDVLAVAGATAQAADRARAGDGPTLVEFKTYRHRAHCMVIPEHRPGKERRQWSETDPIGQLAGRLIDGGLADEVQLDDIHKAQQQRVDEATAFALDSPPPDPAEMEYALYAD